MHPTYLTVIRVPDRAVPAEQLPKFESAPSWTRRGWVGVYRGLGDKPSGIFPTVPRADFCLVSIPYDKLCSGADPARRGHLILREVCLESERGRQMPIRYLSEKLLEQLEISAASVVESIEKAIQHRPQGQESGRPASHVSNGSKRDVGRRRDVRYPPLADLRHGYQASDFIH